MSKRKKPLRVPPGRHPATFLGVALTTDGNLNNEARLAFRLSDPEWGGAVVFWAFGMPSIFLEAPLGLALSLVLNGSPLMDDLSMLLGAPYFVRIEPSAWANGSVVTAVSPIPTT
jgi:hypothetical protein